jgi:hypothetical protein
MAAIRRAPKGLAGGRRTGPKPPSVGHFIVRGRVRPKPANDNPSSHASRKGLGATARIVLTLGASIVVLLAFP